MVIRKYAVALLSIAVLILGALQVALAGGLTEQEAWQLAALVAGAGVTYWVPLVEAKWAGIWKTGFAIIAAVATTLIPIGIGRFTAETWIIPIIAAVNVLATEVGVNIRQDSTIRALPFN